MPALTFMSSGDLAADRRYDYARALQADGEFVAAADLLAQAIERAPTFASAWFALGEVQELLNQHGLAIDAYRKAIVCDPPDRHGASLRLMRLGAMALDAMPQGYVATLFDQYASRFEQSLVGELSYRGPSLIMNALKAIREPLHAERAIDLGCGTGLMARALAAHCSSIIGVDLAPQMVGRAQATGLYESVVVADMVEGLRAQESDAFDLVIAADAVVYVADLVPFAEQAARVLRPGGLLAFTAETHDGEGVVLGKGLRYAHAERYVCNGLAAAELTLQSLERHSARNEDGVPVPGLVVVAGR
jgi:predicted TPR repeat methyltransferase